MSGGCDAGATPGTPNAPATGPLEIVNNVMAGIADTHVRIDSGEAAASSILRHWLFDAPALIRWGDSDTHDVAGSDGTTRRQGDGVDMGAYER